MTTSSNVQMMSLTEFVRANASAVLLTDCHPSLIKEIQSILKIETDGVAGPITKQAFIEFKHANQLEFPLGLGVTTAKELLSYQGREETAANDYVDPGSPAKINPDAGKRSGPSMKLPTGEIVYANQYIVEGIPLTWGEATDNCQRVPTAKEYVSNAVKLARIWGEVRDKFGSPIEITSGYRTPEVNRQVNGARNSQHLYFRALDMKPLNGDFKKLLHVLKASPSFVGIGDGVFMGRNKGFLHADIRPGQRVIFSY